MNLIESVSEGFPSYFFLYLYILYNTICQALDSGKEVRAVFCDISKSFDRVWHVGLLHKFKAAGVIGEILDWFKHYLSDRKQLVLFLIGFLLESEFLNDPYWAFTFLDIYKGYSN